MKTRAKILLSVLLILAASFSMIHFTPLGGDVYGEVRLEVIDGDEETVIDEHHRFYGRTSLYRLLVENYEIDYREDFSKVLLSIETIETDFQNNFLKIKVDGEPADYGMEGVYLEDGAEYTLKVVEVD